VTIIDNAQSYKFFAVDIYLKLKKYSHSGQRHQVSSTTYWVAKNENTAFCLGIAYQFHRTVQKIVKRFKQNV